MNRLISPSQNGTLGTWRRWMPAWHLLFYSVLILTTAYPSHAA
jgi:hypothetical protein